MKAIYWMVLAALTLLAVSGCATTSVYVLDQKELVKIKTGETLTATYDGYFFSNRAIQRIMKAEVEEVKLK